MNMKLMGMLMLGLMVSFQATAAEETVDIKLPKDAASSVPMDIKVLHNGVIKQLYSGNVVRTLSMYSTGPNNNQFPISWDNPRNRHNASDPMLFSEGSTTNLDLDIYTVSPRQTVVKITFHDSNTLRKRLLDGTVEDAHDSEFRFQSVVALKPGKAFKIPYSVCEDDTSELCKRELSIMTK